MSAQASDSRGYRYVVLSGGVGGAKLVQGLALCRPPGQLMVVGNVGDDFEHWGMHVSPDLDTLMYTLAGVANEETGWGRAGETWRVLQEIALLGGESWFRLGDRDLAVHIERTARLKSGVSLSNVTIDLCAALGVEVPVLPVTDDRLRTVVETSDGVLDFQTYFVHRHCEPAVTGLRFEGASASNVLPEICSVLADPGLSAVILCPLSQTPFLSLDPILAAGDLRRRVKHCGAPVVAVSPMIGSKAFKGPTAKIMQELGYNPSTLSIAQYYSTCSMGT
ncbi:MAG: LPPG--FO 2-phospho-L-lactate transferase [Pseudomonadota bacterium]|nr:MAG: LPPG--FO 2-phospho-L-lactate transferase [Pseudomonadota bacterium]